MLFDKFKSFAKENHLFNADSKVLLTVSGGIDSSVMAHLFHRLKMNCTIAHCNFQLRGEESDGDEAFVRVMGEKLNFKVFVTRFETEEYANENHLSIQMAARDLRYNWFNRLAKAHQFDYIAVAHNRDDALETFFINLGRGSGIAGLTGIRPLSGIIMRPLLFASRPEIEQYAQSFKLVHREDSTNASDKYQRNYIRHQVIPGIEDIFPHFRESLSQNLEKLNEAHILYQHALNTLVTQIILQKNGLLYIGLPELLKTPAPKTVLYEILKPYNFTPPTIKEIFHVAGAISGKQFFSSTHKLVKDRECFIVSKLEGEGISKFYIEEGTREIDSPVTMQLEIIECTPDFIIEKSPAVAYLDYDKLIFPLILRKWKQGDFFIPFGMKGIKKVSDFFIDQKLSLIEKENIWLLVSGNQIAWITGKRTDERFRITDETKKVLVVKLS